MACLANQLTTKSFTVSQWIVKVNVAVIVKPSEIPFRPFVYTLAGMPVYVPTRHRTVMQNVEKLLEALIDENQSNKCGKGLFCETGEVSHKGTGICYDKYEAI